MTDTPSLYVLDELWQKETDFSGALQCPGCGTVVCSLGWEGKITQFATGCEGCDSTLLSFSAVCVSDAYHREFGAPTPDEMEAYVTSYWDQKLAEGISETMLTGHEVTDTVELDNGEELSRVEEVIEDVDLTPRYAAEYTYHAENFGWSWSADESDLK